MFRHPRQGRQYMDPQESITFAFSSLLKLKSSSPTYSFLSCLAPEMKNELLPNITRECFDLRKLLVGSASFSFWYWKCEGTVKNPSRYKHVPIFYLRSNLFIRPPKNQKSYISHLNTHCSPDFFIPTIATPFTHSLPPHPSPWSYNSSGNFFV